MKKLQNSVLCAYLILTAGSLICVFGLNCFLLPYKLTMGGYSGIASVLYYVFKLPVGAGMILLNIPTFIFAFKYLGKQLCVRSAYALAVFSAASELMPVTALVGDVFLCALYGGILMGIGLGVNIYFGGSTGGTDLLALIINRLSPALSVSAVLFAVDAFVVLLTAIFASVEAAMYSLILVFLVIKCVDVVTVGAKRARVFVVISAEHKSIEREIFSQIGRGVTELHAAGGYSKRQIPALLCTVEAGAQAAALKRLIEETDADAFVISLDASEVIGRGFGGRAK